MAGNKYNLIFFCVYHCFSVAQRSDAVSNTSLYKSQIYLPIPLIKGYSH